MPYIEARIDYSGNHISSIRFDGDFAYGCDPAVSFARGCLYCGDPFGGGSKRVSSEMHWGGPGVVGLAGKAKSQPRLAHDALDDGQRQPFHFKNGTLLDVDFYEAEG